ncbi:unnamed protein product [Caenorhabditis bovis]|uniref:C2H2-type domain-containing protein n=1 Tax=Caenorhabditis bovis TaxID=2654633 RepID=A0A8S1ESN2_9PELO|nr:unnamed protein product [Caenorhabditis bovis]
MSETARQPVEVKQEVVDDDNDLLAGMDTGTSLDMAVNVVAESEQRNLEKRTRSSEEKSATPEPEEPKPKKRGRKPKISANDDADWQPGKKKPELKTFGMSSRPRRSVNYASLADDPIPEELEEAEGPKRKRKIKDEDLDFSKILAAPYPPKTRKFRAFPDEDLTFDIESRILQAIPSPSVERPVPEQRKLLADVDNYHAVRRGSAGYRRFVAYINDSQFDGLNNAVVNYFEAKPEPLIAMKAKVLRHLWNMMPIMQRKEWEKKARDDAFQSFKLIGLLVLPPCEFPLESTLEKKIRHPRNLQTSIANCDCCELRPTFYNVRDMVSHFTRYHDAVHFYGCHLCLRMFPTQTQWINHSCQAFSSYLLENAINSSLTEMKFALVYLSCSDCGIWIPLRVSSHAEKFWTFLNAVVYAHNCGTLVPVIIYLAREIPGEGVNKKMTFPVYPRINCEIPLCCNECNIADFPNVAAIEAHFKNEHPENLKRCTRCDEKFGTDLAFRFHLTHHFGESLMIANYLKYSATYHPPPTSERLLHYGFKKENVLVGGVTELPKVPKNITADYVQPDENTIRAKFKNSLNDEQRDAGMASNSQNRNKRTDRGYEFFDYSEFNMDDDEIEAAKRIEEIIQKTGDVELIETGDKILEPKKIIELLKDGKAREEWSLENCTDVMAEDIARSFTKEVHVPVSGCTDPLKDFLLVNRIYEYCGKCETLFYTDRADHVKQCDCDNASY